MFKEFLDGLHTDPESFVKSIEKSRAKKDMKAEEQDRLENAVRRVASCNSDGNAVQNVSNTDASFLRHTTPMPAFTWSRHPTPSNLPSTVPSTLIAGRTTAELMPSSPKGACILHCETQVVCL